MNTQTAPSLEQSREKKKPSPLTTLLGTLCHKLNKVVGECGALWAKSATNLSTHDAGGCMKSQLDMLTECCCF